MAHDIFVVDQDTFQLRAERNEYGTGRIYTITYRVTDDCGNSVAKSATVTVLDLWIAGPKDSRSPAGYRDAQDVQSPVEETGAAASSDKLAWEVLVAGTVGFDHRS